MKPGYRKNIFLYVVFLMMVCSTATCQDVNIPVGTWRPHPSFNHVISLHISGDRIFSATPVTVTQLQNGEASTLYSRQPLSDAGITYIAYSPHTSKLIVTYSNGNIDIVEGASLKKFSRFRDLNTITGSRRINHIFIDVNMAYLSTDFGIVVFDLLRNEVKETWRDLGANGESLSIRKSILYRDSIVLATQKGIMIGSLADNLLDFSKWKRIDYGDLAAEVKSIAEWNGGLYAVTDDKGLHEYNGKDFIQLHILTGRIFNSLETGTEKLIITSNDAIFLYSTAGELTEIRDEAIPSPVIGQEDPNGTLWIGDQVTGLNKFSNGNLIPVNPSGPYSGRTFRLNYTGNKIFSIHGGFDSNLNPTGVNGIASYYTAGQWDTIHTQVKNLTDVAAFRNKLYFSSFGDGLVESGETGMKTIYNSSNSELETFSGIAMGTYITDLHAAGDALYIANYGASRSIKKIKSDGSWESLPVNISASMYPVNFTIDPSGNVWMGVDRKFGGGVIYFNPATGESAWLTTALGGGGLPDETITAITTDLGGNVWVGTEAGVAYFYSPLYDAIKPVFENRFLLKDEKITSIAVDGGNRKWIGTERGLWLFNPTGDELIHHFTTENSPLFSNVISDMTIDPVTGEVFIATENGIVSYRSDATASTDKFTAVKIFPNPLTSEFTGTVGISGLATDALVKITDISGKVIWQGIANGGTAAWNFNANGNRPQTGVYLVFASSEDGSESVVGKIAVIE